MTPREVVRLALTGRKPPYVPWAYGFTHEAREKLVEHYGTTNLEPIFRNHLCTFGANGEKTEIEPDVIRDKFGVVWDRTADKDIGVIRGQILPEPSLAGHKFPDPLADPAFAHMQRELPKHKDKFLVFGIGFSLYERAWTLRGMENLLADFLTEPDFVRELLDRITEYNLAQVREALKYDIDAVYFGDDWGDQRGVQMGPELWREFIKPCLARMYGEVRRAGKLVMIHSCGKVDELFDELVEIGLNCFNPFQPEVMDVTALLGKYRGRLAFHGGLSTQRTLPYGTPAEVRAETRHLLELGREGGYIFAPAHAVEGDVPLENLLAFIDTVREEAAKAGM